MTEAMEAARRIIETPDYYFIDHSIHSTFSTCEEKGRLAYVEHLVPNNELPPLVFGTAFHAGVAGLYEATWAKAVDPLTYAKLEFSKVAKQSPLAVPLTSETERRTVERGTLLLEYYQRKWAKMDMVWEEIINPETGTPYIEIGFAIYFMEWHGKPVLYVGKIDRLKRNRVDGMAYAWETKTTTTSPKFYVEQVRPNHQLTGYQLAVKEFLSHIRLAGSILDVIYISDRKIGGKFPDGIDIDNDFARVETRRSSTDLEEFLYDLKLKTTLYLERRDSGMRRWHRNAPTACYMFGGCHYRDACNSNLNPQILKSKYKVKPWHPFDQEKIALLLGGADAGPIGK